MMRALRWLLPALFLLAALATAEAACRFVTVMGPGGQWTHCSICCTGDVCSVICQ